MHDVKCHKLAELFVYDDERFESVETTKRLRLINEIAEAIQHTIEGELDDAAILLRDEPERDDCYERMAARDRLDDFKRTGGKDWT